MTDPPEQRKIVEVGRAGALVVVVLIGACEPPSTGSVDAGIDAGADECATATTAVDLLFLIDNSNSMAQEQASLAACFGGAGSGALVNPPDSDADGATDRQPVGDLHIGFISPDMGTGGYEVTTCDDPSDGDDGQLLHEPSTLVAGCDAEYPRFLEWRHGDDIGELAYDFACLATLGTGGCGWEQPFHAVRRALVDHADGPNRGFLRDDSLLAIVIQSDEDDASVLEDAEAQRVFDPDDEEFGPLNLRPFLHPELLVPPAEVARDLLSLRPCTDRLFVGAIVGIPPETDCSWWSPSPDIDCLLADPAMQERIDDSADGQGERVVPSCDEPGWGEAFPPRRTLELLRELQRGGAAVSVASTCEWEPRRVFEVLAAHADSLANRQ